MSKRQGIQELQARLAKRLEAKDQTGALATWLAVEARGQKFLLPLGQSGELFNPSALVKVPYSKPWFLGLVNHRGALFGVADLAGLPWLGGAPQQKKRTFTAQSRLIVLPGMGDTLCTLAVDKILGLKASQGFRLARGDVDQSTESFLRRLVENDGTIWVEIDLVKLTAMPEFLDIHERPLGAEH